VAKQDDDKPGEQPPKYPFLSQEWMDEARKVRDKYKGKTPAIPHQVRMNQVITDVPFGDGTLHSHMDTSSGELVMEEGHLDDVDLTVTLDYDTAKAIFVEGNPQAGMQAFMAGKVKVQGDMTKLMAMQQSTPDPTAAEIQQQIKDITE
jgi:putative sterol carrier protein